MKKMVGLVHTTRLVLEQVHEAIEQTNERIEISHVLDEGILKRLAQQGEITSEIVAWLASMIAAAEKGGADLAIVSCSSLSPCVDEVRRKVGIPVLKVDEPMMEYAIKKATRIGLLMTNPTTEKPSRQLFEQTADRLGKKPSLSTILCPNAFAMLASGDKEGHDREVIESIELLLKETELVMLAQISMARVKGALAENVKDRVLSSLEFIGPKAGELLGRTAPKE